MYQANGVGLAAQQIGLNIKLFVVDTVQVKKKENNVKGIKGIYQSQRFWMKWVNHGLRRRMPFYSDIRGEVDANRPLE